MIPFFVTLGDDSGTFWLGGEIESDRSEALNEDIAKGNISMRISAAFSGLFATRGFEPAVVCVNMLVPAHDLANVTI